VVTDLARLGQAAIGFTVAMIGIWIALRGRGGWDWVALARGGAGDVGGAGPRKPPIIHIC